MGFYLCLYGCYFIIVLLGNLQPGDQILEVNCESLIGVTSERYILLSYFLYFFY